MKKDHRQGTAPPAQTTLAADLANIPLVGATLCELKGAKNTIARRLTPQDTQSPVTGQAGNIAGAARNNSGSIFHTGFAILSGSLEWSCIDNGDETDGHQSGTWR